MSTRVARAPRAARAAAPVAAPGARRLLEATLRVIGRVGIEAVTHRAVAAEAGVSAGAIAHHFASRDLLVEAALAFAVACELERVHAFARKIQPKLFDRVAWIDALVAWYARELDDDPETHIACFEAFLRGAREPRHRVLVRDWFDAYHQTAELALRAAGSPQPREHAQIFVSALTGLVLQQLALRQPRFRRRIAPLLGGLVAALVSPRQPRDRGVARQRTMSATTRGSGRGQLRRRARSPRS